MYPRPPFSSSDVTRNLDDTSGIPQEFLDHLYHLLAISLPITSTSLKLYQAIYW